jgi:hypothetical protein
MGEVVAPRELAATDGVAAAAEVTGGAAGDIPACATRVIAAHMGSAVTVFKLEFLGTVRQPTALMA